MAITNGPNLGLMVNGNQGEAHYTDLMMFFRGVDGLTQPSVINSSTNTPPGSPTDGDRYIVGPSPTGAWSGKSNQIARWSSAASAWEFYTPKAGWFLYDVATTSYKKYTGSAWAAFSVAVSITPNRAAVSDAGGSIIASATTDAQIGYLSNLTGDAQLQIDKAVDIYTVASPINGFPNRTDTTISYNPATRIITLSAVATNFSYYLKGIKYTVTGSVSSSAHANTTGKYFFYYDSSNVLTISSTPWNILTDVPIALIYYSTTQGDGFIADERHSSYRNPAAHQEMHETIGTYIPSGTGHAIAGYTLATHTDAAITYSLGGGTVADEDIRVALSSLADGGPYKIFYRSGASGEWLWDAAATLPVKYSGSTITYNQNNAGTWQQTPVTNGDYVNYYVLATTVLSSGMQYFIMQGQAEYATLALAQSESFSSIALGSFPTDEFAVIYKITMQFRTSNTGTTRSTIESVADLRSSTRSSTLSSQTTNHNSLAGLQGGAANSYYHSDQDVNTTASPTWVGATLSGLTASRALVTDSSKNLASSSVTSTELGYLSGTTSSVQTQLNGKQASLTGTLSGTANQITVTGTAANSIANNLTLSLPQDIATTSTPTFKGANVVRTDGYATAVIETNYTGATSILVLRSSRTSSANLANGDYAGAIQANSPSNGSYQNLANQICYIDGTYSAANTAPSGWAWGTTIEGSASPVERMRLNSVGELMIGTTTPLGGAVKLQVVGTSAMVNLLVTDASYATSQVVEFYRSGATANYLAFKNGSTGTASGDGLLIGLNASGNAIINHQENSSAYLQNQGVDVLRLNSDGTATAQKKIDQYGTGSSTYDVTQQYNLSSTVSADAFRFLSYTGSVLTGQKVGHLYVTLVDGSDTHCLIYYVVNNGGTDTTNATFLFQAYTVALVTAHTIVTDGGGVKFQLTAASGKNPVAVTRFVGLVRQ